MAPKSTKKTEETETVTEETTSYESPDNFDTEEDIEVDTDFDVEDDYKPEPLMRNGWYKGYVTETELDLSSSRLIWKVTLADNGGVMSDGETQVDGTAYVYNNWLPKKSDKDEVTKSGGNKWQNKVNMLKRFSDDMRIEARNISTIQKNVQEQNWIGIPVSLELKAETYNGITSMKSQNMKRRADEA